MRKLQLLWNIVLVDLPELQPKAPHIGIKMVPGSWLQSLVILRRFFQAEPSWTEMYSFQHVATLSRR